jgi:putative sterol carrier protein
LSETGVPAGELFGSDWAAAFAAAIAASAAYREAARDWEWPLALVETGNPPRGVLLDLYRGHCRGARTLVPQDLDSVPLAIEASPQAWRQLLAENADPLLAVMSGKLRLTRGSLAQLLPYVRAAKELVAVARRTPYDVGST